MTDQHVARDSRPTTEQIASAGRRTSTRPRRRHRGRACGTDDLTEASPGRGTLEPTSCGV
jgi:hypothetical protein